jgi:hypothetical protein
VIFGVAAIWISQTARPFPRMPSMPYRWGVYLGMSAARMSLLSMISSIQALRGSYLLGGLAFGIVAVLAGVSSLGILRRRKFGALAFGLLHVMAMLIVLVLEPLRDQPLSWSIRNKPPSLTELVGQPKLFPTLVSLVVIPLYFVPTLMYFKDRWSLMGK